MKKGKIIIFFTLVISISLFIGSFLGYNLTKDNEVNIIVPEKNIPTIITVEATECKTKNYIELTDYNVYTYCLDHLMLFENNNLVELKNYVPDKPEFITELISNLELETELDDGGTKIYKDKTDYTNGLTLIKCNTLDGNKDIYIGPKDMEYQESFCKNPDSFVKTFTKTYEVLNVTWSNSDEFIYLTLRQFQFEEVETVKVAKSLNYDITAGKNYEFTFEYTTEHIEDNIKSIFNNATLTSIVETDKTGLDQVQDPIN